MRFPPFEPKPFSKIRDVIDEVTFSDDDDISVPKGAKTCSVSIDGDGKRYIVFFGDCYNKPNLKYAEEYARYYEQTQRKVTEVE